MEDGRKVISNVISTSERAGPIRRRCAEIASRRHAEYISATVDKALADANMTMKDVDAVAVTFAPGLIGAVLVGVNFAKDWPMRQASRWCRCTTCADISPPTI